MRPGFGAGFVVLLCIAAAFARAEAERPDLRVGTSGDYAPFSKAGQGFDVDAARLVAAALGRNLVLVPFRWPELAERLARGDFDVAMSGVTWRPERAVVGRMSLAVAIGGPCWLGAASPKSVAVNRGGVLERFARVRFPNARVETVEANLSLPRRLASGEVDAIVTDSFELEAFARAGDPRHCEPARDRKVWWVAPARAAVLGAALDPFVRAREPELAKLREKWFGAAQPQAEADRLVDLIARRLAFMPSVGAWKRAHERPIADPAQEARVLENVAVSATGLGLDPVAVRALFALEIELAKRLQTRAAEAAAELDLETQLRPALAELSDRQLESLALAAPLDPRALDEPTLEPLRDWLEPAEVTELVAALSRIR
jgi:ABC-type amino acid transport substrate-binding protein